MKYLLVLLALLGVAQAQDITGNLVNNTATATTTTSTWQNVVFDTQLQCWEPGGPGNCGPNATYNLSTQSINFSYGTTDAWQKVNIAKALPYGGTGLVTTGFRFSWMSKNGNGWDDGRLDQLDAYVKLYSSGDSKVLENYNWNLNYLHDWTTFDYTVNWANTKLGYRENQLGNVQYGFVGRDNNFWAGTYGPEVMSVSFQLKYKPDPCKNNPLYSPECPNFTQELQKANSTPIPSEATKQQYIEEQLPEYKHQKPQEQQFADGSKEPGASSYYSIDAVESALFKIFDSQFKQEERVIDIAKDAVERTEQVSEKVTKQAEAIARESQARSIRESLELKPEMLGQTQALKRDSQDSLFSLFQGPSTTNTSVTAFKLPGPQTTTISLQQKDIIQQEQASTVSSNNRNTLDQQLLADQLNKSNRDNSNQSIATTNTVRLNTITTTNISLDNTFKQPDNTSNSNDVTIAPSKPIQLAMPQSQIESSVSVYAAANNSSSEPIVITNQLIFNNNVVTDVASATNTNSIPATKDIETFSIQPVNITSTSNQETVTTVQNSISGVNNVELVDSTASTVSTSNPVLETVTAANLTVTPMILELQIIPVVQYMPANNNVEIVQPLITLAIVKTNNLDEQLNTATEEIKTNNTNKLTSISNNNNNIETPVIQNSFLTNKNDPLNEAMESKPVEVAEQKQESKQSTVNKSAQDSDVAGVISIDSIARIPVGFNTYMVALVDVPFYQSKEIYRNQRTIDNRRALNQLRSDKLHDQLIDLQYRRD